MRYIETRKLTGLIRVETGLHIGAGFESAAIGEVDFPVVRHPATREPYIPGSSLKGRMRALIEWKLGKVGANGGAACACGDCPACRVFGSPTVGASGETKKAERRGPTRLIVRDSFVTPESRARFRADYVPMIEEKAETQVNRLSASANPRILERAVPGLEFGLEILYRIIDTDDGGARDAENWDKVVLTALGMVRADALGGGSSRGNGKVEFAGLADGKGNPVTLPEF
jgi:CRISPR-associated protein Csm3